MYLEVDRVDIYSHRVTVERIGGIDKVPFRQIGSPEEVVFPDSDRPCAVAIIQKRAKPVEIGCFGVLVAEIPCVCNLDIDRSSICSPDRAVELRLHDNHVGCVPDAYEAGRSTGCVEHPQYG